MIKLKIFQDHTTTEEVFSLTTPATAATWLQNRARTNVKKNVRSALIGIYYIHNVNVLSLKKCFERIKIKYYISTWLAH